MVLSYCDNILFLVHLRDAKLFLVSRILKVSSSNQNENLINTPNFLANNRIYASIFRNMIHDKLKCVNIRILG